MKFTTHIEVPVTITYTVGFSGGVSVDYHEFVLGEIDFDEIAQEHYDGYCEEMEERKMDANDMLYEMRQEKYRLGGDTDVY